MKRTICLFFALVLVLSAVCGAASAEKTFKTPYYTLKLPAGWDYDTEETEIQEKNEENLKYLIEEGEQYLGLFYEDKYVGMAVLSYILYYEDLKDISLWNSDKAFLQEYADDLMDEFADDDPEYLDVVMVGQDPFVIIKGTDEDGEYLHVETMTNGFAVVFRAYVTDEDGEKWYPITNKYIEQFKSVLEGFQRVE